MSRRKKLLLNTATALALQLVTFVCKFILTRVILSYFGSEVNGLVSSVTNFLSVIAVLELGVGAVVQSGLYKPLAEKDMDAVSRIVASAEKFYRRLACIFLVYTAVLFFTYPRFNTEFSFWYTAWLLLILSASTFAEYYFGITWRIFLNADQKMYICSAISMAAIMLNAVLSIALMRMGCSIHIVNFAAAVVYIIKPLALNRYVHWHYRINRKIAYEGNPIPQRWNGFAQSLAAVVCQDIDIVLLTLFSTYQNVSIYSAYLLVARGMHNLIMTAVSGLEAFWGNMIVKREEEKLRETFAYAEVLIHGAVCVLFTAMSILIAPFISVYVKNIDDAAAYQLPLFGALLSFAYGALCLRTPYFKLIKAAGHYKETQNGAFLSMMVNIVASAVLLKRMGLVGVAAGTVAAMLFHTVYCAWYLRKAIIHRPFRHFMKHMAVDAVIMSAISFLTRDFGMGSVSYLAWIIYAVRVTAVALLITAALNIAFYWREMAGLIRMIFQNRQKKRRN